MTLNLKQYLTLSFVVAVIAISSAFTMQYAFDMQPCKFCLLQRIPFYIIIALFTLQLFFQDKKYVKELNIIFILAFLINAIIAFYHTGIEYGVFHNFLNCAATGMDISDPDLLRDFILNTEVVSCDKPAFKFILSLSGWNFLLCFSLGIFGSFNYIKNK